jgi:hypothetical protein
MVFVFTVIVPSAFKVKPAGKQVTYYVRCRLVPIMGLVHHRKCHMHLFVAKVHPAVTATGASSLATIGLVTKQLLH